MRCSHCSFDNLPGVTVCQVCNSRLSGLACSRCNFQNPPDYSYCGRCGQPLLETPAGEPSTVSVAVSPRARQPKPAPASPPGPTRMSSPVALVGFGAVLALASVAFPWYLLGSSPASEEQTISRLLEGGWKWFPGVPLTLIALASVSTTLIAILGGSSRARPLAAVVMGFVTLFCSAWLWQGYRGPDTGAAGGSFTPATGAILATVAAIVLVVTGLWTFHTLRSR